mmetsp:Transcript_39501/g.99571  ORF Transcript_39501/g.99571 Transcript_39501/m.99571 type:complete len:225 (+) Transcript_39501:930-1604(+)
MRRGESGPCRLRCGHPAAHRGLAHRLVGTRACHPPPPLCCLRLWSCPTRQASKGPSAQRSTATATAPRTFRPAARSSSTRDSPKTCRKTWSPPWPARSHATPSRRGASRRGTTRGRRRGSARRRTGTGRRRTRRALKRTAPTPPASAAFPIAWRGRWMRAPNFDPPTVTNRLRRAATSRRTARPCELPPRPTEGLRRWTWWWRAPARSRAKARSSRGRRGRCAQ